jgi:hypothetical protein
MQLNNAVAVWEKDASEIFSLKRFPVTHILTTEVPKNPCVVREFGADLQALENAMKDIKRQFNDLGNDSKHPAQKERKPIWDKALKCLGEIIKAVAQQIEADKQLHIKVNKALQMIFSSAHFFLSSPVPTPANLKRISDAVVEYNSLTTSDQSYHGPNPKYWPKDPVLLQVPVRMVLMAQTVLRAHQAGNAKELAVAREQMEKTMRGNPMMHV